MNPDPATPRPTREQREAEVARLLGERDADEPEDECDGADRP